MGLFGKKHSIGKTIAELRKAKGWTQVELAEKLQVSDKAISKWEKDNGSPSVEFFPVLAELFGVSIDYIMTGKETEKEVVTMSKIELCAKKDDVKLFNSLSEEVIGSKDDNGKTLLDYAFEYRCPKVVDSLLTKYSAKDLYDWTCSGEYIVKFWYPEQIAELLLRYNRIKELDECNAFPTKLYSCDRRTRFGNELTDIIHSKQFAKIILTDSNISDELKTKYFQSCTSQELFYCVDELIAANDSKQITTVVKFVKAAYPVSLIDKLLDNGFVDIAKQANKYNASKGYPVLNPERFAYVEGKKSGKLSEKQLATLEVVKNGIIDIDLLAQIKDYATVKYILENNAIHKVEILYNWLKAGKVKDLFRYAVDNKLENLVRCIKSTDNEKIKAELVAVFKSTCTSIGYPTSNGKTLILDKQYYQPSRPTIEEIIKSLYDYKQKILTDLSYEHDKQTTISDLTKEYFNEELEKGNHEMVIIKLCVRLEAILRCDYHYEGDFSEMLNAFCNRINDSYASKILNKLRMHRNSIVHSEKESEQLSIDELKFCIDYICKLG